MRGRGLKHLFRQERPGQTRSPPMRGRGLKLGDSSIGMISDLVAPHAGAWIETTNNLRG